MSDVIISRRYINRGRNPILITEIIVENSQWVVPNYAINNTFDVRVFGGGGGGWDRTAGDGGYMNNAIFTNLTPGTSINITIGDGGQALLWSSINAQTGGTSSFGSYLSANGGRQHATYGGGNGLGDLSGGTGTDGTLYGGGGGAGHYVIDAYSGNGGNGGMYGGGGGSVRTNGGNGGMYGGGGGGGGRYINNADSVYMSYGGIGGQYGANGGNGGLLYNNADISILQSRMEANHANGYNGVNTIGMDLEYTGTGNGGRYGYCTNSQNSWFSYGGGGGGGYGGQGGRGGGGRAKSSDLPTSGGGGGGGYGGNGGGGTIYCGGGGGGYGSNGGNNGGGGGGYGKGADGGSFFGGGGGYFSKGGQGVVTSSHSTVVCGGGASYGRGGNKTLAPLYGGGGAGINETGQNGAMGVCIIQYYI